MSDKLFPSCAYDVCAEFDCEETMALALIATRNKLERTCKALDVAVNALKWIAYDENNEQDGFDEFAILQMMEKADGAIKAITELEQKDCGNE